MVHTSIIVKGQVWTWSIVKVEANTVVKSLSFSINNCESWSLYGCLSSSFYIKSCQNSNVKFQRAKLSNVRFQSEQLWEMEFICQVSTWTSVKDEVFIDCESCSSNICESCSFNNCESCSFHNCKNCSSNICKSCSFNNCESSSLKMNNCEY